MTSDLQNRMFRELARKEVYETAKQSAYAYAESALDRRGRRQLVTYHDL
jgi:hypothetical protein